MWHLILHYQIGRKLESRKIKNWAKALVPGVTNFTTSWNDGKSLCNIVNYIQPGMLQAIPGSTDLDHCRRGLDIVAIEFGVPDIITPEDLNDPEIDNDTMLLYLSYLFAEFQKRMLSWLNGKLPRNNITNFSHDWKDGNSFAALLNVCQFPRKDLEEMDQLNIKEKLEKCLVLINQQFNIANQDTEKVAMNS